MPKITKRMKNNLYKLLLTILITFFFSISLFAKKERTISLTFRTDEFKLIEEDGQIFITTTAYNTVFKNDSLSPALPYICMYALIGPDEDYISSSITTTEILFQDNVYLSSNPHPVPTNSMDATMSSINNIYEDSSYPSINVDYTGPFLIGGFQVLSFLVCPFNYNTIEHKLYLSNQIDIHLSLGYKNSDKEYAHTIIPSDIKDQISKLIVNPEDINSLYTNISEEKSKAESSYNSSISDAPINYLIITCDSLKNEFLRLANWRTERGLKAELMTVEDIYHNYTDRNNPLKIKHAIKDKYESSGNALQYVLLGGGNNIIPVQYCYAILDTASASAPSDLFYACVQNLEWDTNGNGKYGELSDSISLSPDFALGRLPATNITQAKTMIERILKYEMNPDTVGWKDEILMCAACDQKCLFNNDSVSWFHATSERLCAQFFPSQWIGKKYRFYDTGTDHVLDMDYQVTGYNLQNELSKGYSLVNVLTHGNYFVWNLETDGDYWYNDAASLYSTHCSFIVTQACRTNDINSSYSLGNNFMQNPNGKILGLWGCSHNAYGASRGLLGAIEKVSGFMYHQLFTTTNFIGKAIQNAQLSYLSSYQSNNDYRWNHLFLVASTDPGLCLYTSKPISFDQLNVTHYGNSITIYLGTPGFYACAMSRHDNGNTYWNSIGSNGSSFSFYNLPCECILFAWYPNYIPFRTIFASNVYLQNEVLNDNLNVTADYVYIGNHVTADREEGPVFVDNGKSIISYNYGVIIQNDFEVKPGASLLIRKMP